MKKLIVILISLLSVQITFASPMRLALISVGAIRCSLHVSPQTLERCINREVFAHELRKIKTTPVVKTINQPIDSLTKTIPSKITFETYRVVGKYLLHRTQQVAKHTFSSLVLEGTVVRKNFIRSLYEHVGLFIAQLPAGIVPDTKILSAGLLNALCKLTPK